LEKKLPLRPTIPCRTTWSTRSPAGGAAGKVPELSKMLDEYYGFRGWETDGVPSESKLK
jgi:aldehyde:ferredoxin oxidoreductase